MFSLPFPFSLLFLQGQEHLKVEQESESPKAEEVLGSYTDLKVPCTSFPTDTVNESQKGRWAQNKWVEQLFSQMHERNDALHAERVWSKQTKTSRTDL